MSRAHLGFHYRMKNFFQKQREIMAVLIFGVIIFALVYFVIFPLMGKIDAKKYQIQEAEMKSEIIKQQISELPRIQKQYETLMSDGDLNDVLLDKDMAVTLIEKLEKLAQRTGSDIVISVQEQVDPKKTTTAKAKANAEVTILGELPSAEYLQLKIGITGKYESIVEFVKALEDFEYYCDIIGIQIDKYNEGTTKASPSAITNPFSSSEKNSTTKITKNSDDELVAFLDTVFYAKQN